MSEFKKHRSPLFIVFFTIFIDLLGFGIVLPLSPYYAEHFGASAALVGLLQASYSFMQFLFAPVWGSISDRVGRRPIILMSILGGFFSFFIFACAQTLWVLFLARMLQGIFGANISASQAYVADVTSKENRAKGMGMVGAAFGLGFIFGPAIGAQLSHLGPVVGEWFGLAGQGPFGMGFPAFVASLLCLCNFAFAFFKLPESLKKELRSGVKKRSYGFDNIFKYLKNPEAGWLIAMFFLTSFAMANMESTLALFTEKRMGFGIRQTGNLFAFVGVMIAFTQGYLIRKLLPRFGERSLITRGPFLAALGLGGIALTTSVPSLYFTMIFLAIGSGVSNPAILGGISQVTDANEQGSVFGVTQSLGSLARILGPIGGGLLFSNMGPSAPYYFACAVMVIAMLLALRNVSKLPETRGASPLVLH